MEINNRITELFGIKYPVIQGGMVWVSGWKLAAAVSESGGLGLIGAGWLKPEALREHIKECKKATSKPFGVNIPLLRADVEDLIKVVVEEEVKIVFSSAGHPGKYLQIFKDAGMKVAHVVSSVKHGLKAESVGCDAIVGEGVEAGGHNGADEITTFCLTPQLADAVKIPLIAAGGITDGRGILAALALGAEGVQMGTRFAATVESEAHESYKQRVIEAKDNETTLVLKKLGMARMFKNEFSTRAIEAEFSGADAERLKVLLGKKREMKGIYEGDLQEGMMEAGQGSGLIKSIPTVSELFGSLVSEYNNTKSKF